MGERGRLGRRNQVFDSSNKPRQRMQGFYNFIALHPQSISEQYTYCMFPLVFQFHTASIILYKLRSIDHFLSSFSSFGVLVSMVCGPLYFVIFSLCRCSLVIASLAVLLKAKLHPLIAHSLAVGLAPLGFLRHRTTSDHLYLVSRPLAAVRNRKC